MCSWSAIAMRKYMYVIMKQSYILVSIAICLRGAVMAREFRGKFAYLLSVSMYFSIIEEMRRFSRPTLTEPSAWVKAERILPLTSSWTVIHNNQYSALPVVYR